MGFNSAFKGLIFPLCYDFVCSIERLADARTLLQEVKCAGI